MEKLKVRENGHIVTCGIILIDENDNILAGHTTGKEWRAYGTYDILKGCAEEGEEDIDAAIRELKEESSFDATVYKDKIEDIGIFNYLANKDIHLFKLRLNFLPKLSTLKCDSFFERDGKQIPEINEFRIIRRSERQYFSKSLLKVFKKTNL